MGKEKRDEIDAFLRAKGGGNPFGHHKMDSFMEKKDISSF